MKRLIPHRLKSALSGVRRNENFPDWEAILNTNRILWKESRKRAKKGPKVLLATNVGGLAHATILESLLAAALTLRGADAHLLLCDGVLPGCLRVGFSDISPTAFEQYKLPENVCKPCQFTGEQVYNPLKLVSHKFSRFITETEFNQVRKIAAGIPLNEIAEFRYDSISVGEHAYAGALRYFARGDISLEPKGEIVIRRYLEASMLTYFVMQRLLKSYHFDVSCFHHGIYVPQGITGEVCRKAGVKVVNWNPSYRKNTFIFSHNDSYHHTLLSEPTDVWENIDWNDRLENEIVNYLKSRWYGTRDWIWFHEKPDDDAEKFAKSIGLNLNKPCIGMLTNVIWDAQLHYRANAFPNMLVWVFETIKYFEKRPDLQLIIRIHPAEIRGTSPSRQPLLLEINKHFKELPKNVFVIPPESPVSTYAVMMKCNSVIIYGTKTGVELTSMGIPVIVGGEAWIRNKGLTLDASSPEEYFNLLDSLPLSDVYNPDIIKRARKYAFHFFFRRMIPLPFMEPVEGGNPPYKISIPSLERLLPGSYPGLDVICEGILDGKPFIYEAEKRGIHDENVIVEVC